MACALSFVVHSFVLITIYRMHSSNDLLFVYIRYDLQIIFTIKVGFFYSLEVQSVLFELQILLFNFS